MGHNVRNVPSKEIENIMHEDMYEFKWLWDHFIVKLLFSYGKELRRINNHVLERVISSGRRIKVVALIFAFAFAIVIFYYLNLFHYGVKDF